MIRATINNIERDFEEGTSILEAARGLGIEVPTLCDDPRLKPCAACRMCLVAIKGRAQPIASCTTRLEAGMEIQTESAKLERARRINLEMLAHSYPVDALSKFPDKPFHQELARIGVPEPDFAKRNGEPIDDSHPYIRVDMTQCIDCYRCIRICDELQGQFVWQVSGFGQNTRIIPDSGSNFSESSCVSCGACVDTCPTGALEDKSVIHYGTPDTWVKTVCPYCGTGCELYAGVKDSQIVQVKPAHDSPVNKGHLCVKGRYAFEFGTADDRITEPMIRKGDEWVKVSWKEAINFAASGLASIVDRYGSESAGLLGSARATNEENYLAQKFARVVLETNNVDCCARVCHTPSAAAMKMTLGTGAATNSFDDIELAKTILICGANPTENHPIPGARMKQAVRNGTNLIVIDPRRTELASYADIHLQLTPGTNIPLFNSLAHVIIEEELFDGDFITERVEDFVKFKDFVKDYTPEMAAEICGVKANDIRRAARMYANAKPAMCFHGLGMTEHTQGTEGVICIVNLALLTGNIGKRGTGVNPLRGQNNVQGSAHMGCDPGNLTGIVPIEDGRELFEKVWQTAIPKQKGLNLLKMMDAAVAERFKALWVIGYDVFLTNANAHTSEKAFGNLDLVVIQDMFLNETAKKFGHVFFPVASSFEKDGTFMNSERRVQRIRKVLEPPGNTRADWQIICDIAGAMGKKKFFDFNSPEEIWDEIRAVWKAGEGIIYKRLETHGLQWPCPDQSHPGTEVLHGESFAHAKKTALRKISYIPTKEKVSKEFPLLLNTGRSLYHFNAGTMTERTLNLELRPTDLLAISETDARKLGLSEGETVRLQSAYGEALIPIHINGEVKQGQLFATFHSAHIFLNRITSPHRDRFVQAPEYKVTAVKIEKIGSSNGNKAS